jgi:DNA-binding transcriptional regulator YiaG
MNPRYHPDPNRPPLQDRAEATMTPEQYRRAIDKLGLSQVRAARFLGIGDTAGQGWARGDTAIPHAVELLLKVMLKHDIAPGDLDRSFRV